MWKVCTGGACDLRGAYAMHVSSVWQRTFQRRRSTRIDPLISARRRMTTSRTTSPRRRFSTVNRMVTFLDLCQESLTSTRTLPEISGFAAMEKASSTSSMGST